MFFLKRVFGFQLAHFLQLKKSSLVLVVKQTALMQWFLVLFQSFKEQKIQDCFTNGIEDIKIKKT